VKAHSHGYKIIAILSLTLVLLWCTPVMAASIDITVSGDIPNMILKPGITNNDTSVHLNVTTTDTSSWTISARDASNGGKPETQAGHMVEWNGTSYVTNPKVLGANMTVKGTDVLGATGSYAVLSGADQVIESGTEVVNLLDIPIVISQAISFSDPHLADSHVYRLVVTFTGSAA
jgi:hypothetical protein